MFQQILDSVDKTKYDTCTIEYWMIKPYLSDFNHPLDFYNESLNFIEQSWIVLSDEQNKSLFGLKEFIFMFLVFCLFVYFCVGDL